MLQLFYTCLMIVDMRWIVWDFLLTKASGIVLAVEFPGILHGKSPPRIRKTPIMGLYGIKNPSKNR